MRRIAIVVILIGVALLVGAFQFEPTEQTTIEISNQNPDTTVPYEELSSEEKELIDEATKDGFFADDEAGAEGIHFTGTTGVTVDGESYLLLVSHETVPHPVALIGSLIGSMFIVGGVILSTETVENRDGSGSTIEIKEP